MITTDTDVDPDRAAFDPTRRSRPIVPRFRKKNAAP